MKRLAVVLCAALLCAVEARAIDSFEATLVTLSPNLAEIQAKARALPKKVEQRRLLAPLGSPIADAGDLVRLSSRALNHADFSEETAVSGVAYKIYAVFSTAALSWHVCASEGQERHALYLALPASGPGRAVCRYRFVSECVTPDAALVRFFIEADAQGVITDAGIYDAQQKRVFHPGGQGYTASHLRLLNQRRVEVLRLFRGP